MLRHTEFCLFLTLALPVTVLASGGQQNGADLTEAKRDASETPADAPAKKPRGNAGASQSARQESERQKKISDSTASPRGRLSDSRETLSAAEVHQFVRKNQPKLMGLLTVLQEKSPAQHEAAIRDLSRSVERLLTLEQRDAELYAIELKLWRVKSELRQKVAELAIEPELAPGEAEERLRPLVDRENRQELRRLALLKKRALEQVARVDEQILDRKSQDSAAMQRTMKSWLGQVRRQQSRAKQAGKQRARKQAAKQSETP